MHISAVCPFFLASSAGGRSSRPQQVGSDPPSGAGEEWQVARYPGTVRGLSMFASPLTSADTWRSLSATWPCALCCAMDAAVWWVV